MFIGYARVSTEEQETTLQLDALRRAGCRRIFQEKASAVSSRPALQRTLAAMKPGDVLVVWKLDRLARSLRDLLDLLDALKLAGCSFRSLTEPVDTSSAMGELVLQILGAVAQFERRLIRERAIAGQVAAYQRGVRWGGRAPALDDLQRARVKRLRANGYTMEEIGEQLGVSRSTVSRVLTPKKKKSTRGALPVLGKYLGQRDLF